jgi:hypothetical protein
LVFTWEKRFKEGREERLARETESPWSLHIRSFWEIHFINPPEVQGRVRPYQVSTIENNGKLAGLFIA